MKKILFLGLTAGLLLVTTHYKAQVSNYSFTQTLSTYGNPNTGSLVGAQFQYDDVTAVSLPFAFVYNGTTYNNVNVCSNGYLSFNSISGSDYSPISTSTTQNVVSAFGNGLQMGVLISADLTTGSNTLTNCSSVIGYSVGDILLDYNSDFASNPVITAISGNKIVVNTNALNTVSAYDVANSHGYIKQSVSGITPNRICEFEFRNFSRYVYDELVNFKIRLYETSNKIEFVYGTFIPGNDVTPCEVGLKGTSNSDFNSRKVNSPTIWANSIASSSISDYCDFDSSIFPATGQSYMWTPVTCTVPVLNVVATSTSICSGQQVVLTGSGATTYSWTNGPSTAQNSVTPSTTTSYTLIGANTTCTSSIVRTISVTPNPTLNIAQSSASTCAGQTATLTASGATSYSWNGVATSAQLTVSPSTTTTYSLTGNNGACSASKSVVQTVISCTGIHETQLNSADAGIQTYPNPFNSTLAIKNTANKEQNVVICDALGKIVLTVKIKADATETLSTEFLTSGLYFISAKGENGSYTKKLIKE